MEEIESVLPDSPRRSVPVRSVPETEAMGVVKRSFMDRGVMTKPGFIDRRLFGKPFFER